MPATAVKLAEVEPELMVTLEGTVRVEALLERVIEAGLVAALDKVTVQEALCALASVAGVQDNADS